MTNFIYGRDQSGWPSNAVKPADLIYGVKLAMDTEQHFTIPTNGSQIQRYYARLSYQSATHPFVGVNVTAAAPTGTVGVVNAELTPPGLIVQSGDVISMIEPDNTCYITIALFEQV